MAERGCQVYFDMSTGYNGDPVEWDEDLIPENAPECELVFATQAELEIRLEANRGH
jgi:hypothetical protein